jgi:signal transduction histidine kinase
MLNQIEQIKNTTENITRILEFAQTYEAVGSQGLSWIQVHKAINEAQSLFSGLKDVQINVANMDFEVLADSALVEIFHNLFDNSLKYAQGSNPLQMRIYAEHDENGNLQLIYEDNGQGIDEKIRPQLFNKGVGNSTGLGLYLIQRICDIYGWTVQENGETGKGARFVLSIPKELSRPK